MSDTVEPRIVERLRKLLALAGNNDNENEAASAMAKAQEIMAEYNLSMANIDAGGGSTTSVDQGGAREKVKTPGRALYQYQRELMKTISELNFCFCSLREYGGEWDSEKGKQTPKRKGYQLIGRQANVITTQIMFDYVNAAMERLVPINSNSERLSRFAISWKEGFSHRVVERLRNQKWEMEQASAREKAERATVARHPSAAPTGTAMMLVDVAQNERDLNTDFECGYEPGTSAWRRAEYAAECERRARERALAPIVDTPPPVRVLTEAEKTAAKKQRLKDEAWSKKYWERQDKRDRQKWANKDMNAYRAGQSEGSKINLDTQVKHDPLKGVR